MADIKAKYILQAEDRTQLAVKKAETGFKKLSKTVTKLGGPLAALGIGVGLERLVSDAFRSADAIGKTADKIGITTDALQVLRFAAERTGVSQEQLNSNMTAFVKRVGEAAENTGPLVAFLKKYDQQLLENIKNTETQEEALDLIAESIKNAGSATERAAIANAAFSRSGIGMVNTLRDGKAGLDDWTQSAQDAGVVMDEELIWKAAELNDRWDTFTNTIGTKLKTGILEAASAYDQLLQRFDIGLTGQNRFNKLLEDSIALEKQISAAQERQDTGRRPLASLTGLKKDLEAVNQELKKLSDRKIRDIKIEFEESKAPAALPGTPPTGNTGERDRAAKRLQDQFQAALEAMHRAKAALTETTQFERTLWEVQNGRFKHLTENQQQALLNAARSVDQRQAQLDAERQAAETAEALQRKQDEYNQSQETAAQRWRDLLNPMEEVDKQLVELDQLLAEGKISWDLYGDAVFHVMDGLDEPVAKAKQGTDQMTEFAKQAASNMQDSFANFLFDPFDSNLRGMLSSFVDTIRRMASEMLSQQLLQSFFSALGGTSGGTNIASTFLAAIAHEGGIAGAPGSKTRQVPALAFAGTIAPRFHNGGIAESMGIKPNEIPAVLEKGEGVFTKQQMAAMGGSAGRSELPVSVTIVDDRKSAESIMQGQAGERATLAHIQQNAQTIKRLLT